MKRRRFTAILAVFGVLGSGGYLAIREPTEDTASPQSRPVAPSTATATPATTATPAATATATATETAGTVFAKTKTYGDVELTVSRPSVTTSVTVEGEKREPADGKVFLLLHLTAENVANEGPVNPPRDLTYRYDGTRHRVTTGRDIDATDEIESPDKPLYNGNGGIWPGVTRKGWVFGEVPAGRDQVTVAWKYRGYRADERTIEWSVPIPD